MGNLMGFKDHGPFQGRPVGWAWNSKETCRRMGWIFLSPGAEWVTVLLWLQPLLESLVWGNRRDKGTGSVAARVVCGSTGPLSLSVSALETGYLRLGPL
jgi:hypothetical protein